MLRCYIRSLPKNLTLLSDMLYCLNEKPDVIAISETRLNECSVSNIMIPNYRFFPNDSPTAAGGAGIYISEDIKSIPRPELLLNMPLVESCWVEIDQCNGKTHTIIGCIYRHPSANILRLLLLNLMNY